MHQYMGPQDSLRVNKAEITSTALDQKMRRLVKIGRKVKEHTYSFGLDMFTHDNKCPKVIFSTFPVSLKAFGHFRLGLLLFQLCSLKT